MTTKSTRRARVTAAAGAAKHNGHCSELHAAILTVLCAIAKHRPEAFLRLLQEVLDAEGHK